MKNLSKIGLILLMLLLVAGAFILPKFVQRAVPPTPKEDLAAALAAVEVNEEEAPVADVVGSGLRENPEFDQFFQFLDASDFESASGSLVKLSETIDKETLENLTSEMEKSVNALVASGDSPVEAPEPMVEEPTAAPDIEAPPAEVAPASVYNPAKTVEIMTLIQKNEFAAVEEQLSKISGSAPAETIELLTSSLANARKQKKELEESRVELSKTKKEINNLQKESVAQIKESVAELKEATLSANLAVKEVNALREELKASGPVVANTAKGKQSDEKKEATPPPLKIPATKGITFGVNSTYLSDKSKKLLTDAAGILKAEKRLNLQLRGYADPSGTAEYNAILAMARSEAAKDFLIEKEISASRVSVISFGDTRSGTDSSKAGELRRVDLVFRSE